MKQARHKPQARETVCGQPECAECKHRQDFELPETISKASADGSLVLFAGAGVSTESSFPMPYSFYDTVRAELKLPAKTQLPFPELMTRLCAKTNGTRRFRELLKARLDYIDSFPELLLSASHFHREVSTLPHLDIIITTNWDTYFERFCGAVPLVTDEDFAFWDLPCRKVLKLHGSVSNYGSLIATSTAYKKGRRAAQRNALGAALRILLATRTVVFVGYSFRDPDFALLYKQLTQCMGSCMPQQYAVCVTEDAAAACRKYGIRPITTDAIFFIQSLKRHLISKGHMIDESRFDGLPLTLNRVRNEHALLHQRFPLHATPESVFSASYQDGLTHAFERMQARLCTGEYSCGDAIRQKIKAYERMQQTQQKDKDFIEVAYLEGYSNGLVWLLATDAERRAMPLYYLPGVQGGPTRIEHYVRFRSRFAGGRGPAVAQARKTASQLRPGLTWHHPPFAG